MVIKEHPCSCWKNCDKFSEDSGTTPDGEEWPMYYCDGVRIYDDDINQTKRCGCMSHPKAREYLLNDIIDEIEFSMGIDCDVKLYTWILDLIRNGVKKC